MLKHILIIVLSLLCVAGIVYTFLSLSGKTGMAAAAVCAFLLGILLMNLRLNVKNDKINSYKRELEKESINSVESTSRVKVLEAKIEVLEKALENALKK